MSEFHAIYVYHKPILTFQRWDIIKNVKHEKD